MGIFPIMRKDYQPGCLPHLIQDLEGIDHVQVEHTRNPIFANSMAVFRLSWKNA